MAAAKGKEEVDSESEGNRIELLGSKKAIFDFGPRKLAICIQIEWKWKKRWSSLEFLDSSSSTRDQHHLLEVVCCNGAAVEQFPMVRYELNKEMVFSRMVILNREQSTSFSSSSALTPPGVDRCCYGCSCWSRKVKVTMNSSAEILSRRRPWRLTRTIQFNFTCLAFLHLLFCSFFSPDSHFAGPKKWNSFGWGVTTGEEVGLFRIR